MLIGPATAQAESEAITAESATIIFNKEREILVNCNRKI
jgi:hypothetical protein